MSDTAAWLATTRRLLSEAASDRNQISLRRAAIRIDSIRFKALPDDEQEELLTLYGQAMVAAGGMFP